MKPDFKAFLSAILVSTMLFWGPLHANEFLTVRPDTRESADIGELPSNPFARIIAVVEQEIASFSDKYAKLNEDLLSAGMQGLAWHSDPQHRRIMFGSTPLKEGQVVPRWLASDGSDFRLIEIGLREIIFEHLPNGSRFALRFNTRKTYEEILDAARPPKESSSKTNSSSAVTEVKSPSIQDEVSAEAVSDGEGGGPASKIMPGIQTFTREAVDERRRKEDELFFLKDGNGVQDVKN